MIQARLLPMLLLRGGDDDLAFEAVAVADIIPSCVLQLEPSRHVLRSENLGRVLTPPFTRRTLRVEGCRNG